MNSFLFLLTLIHLATNRPSLRAEREKRVSQGTGFKFKTFRGMSIKLLIGILFGACLLCFQTKAAENKQSKPNIIFFLVDDMGWQETSVPFWKEKTMLNNRYFTPNMESLAEKGMKFTQAYACPLCSPTRVSLMTGMNAARHRVTNWTLRKNKSPDNQHEILEIPDWNMNGISPVPGVENLLCENATHVFKGCRLHNYPCWESSLGRTGNTGRRSTESGIRCKHCRSCGWWTRLLLWQI